MIIENPGAALVPSDILRGLIPSLCVAGETELSIQQVGIEFQAIAVVDHRGNNLETRGGWWNLNQGSYTIDCGVRIPDWMWQRMNLIPRFFGRSSNLRCGVSVDFFADRSKEPETPFQAVIRGPITASYRVLTPHGIALEQKANLGQICFSTIEVLGNIGPPLHASRVFSLISKGRIGREGTTVPEYREVQPDAQTSWKLAAGQIYIVEVDRDVSLSENEAGVLMPINRGDDYSQAFHITSNALIDPGYKGKVRVLLYVGYDSTITRETPLVRMQKFNVLPLGKLLTYRGQF